MKNPCPHCGTYDHNLCEDCGAFDHGEWVVLEFNEDFNYGGVFKTKEEAEAYAEKAPNFRNDGLHVVARCHWVGEVEG